MTSHEPCNMGQILRSLAAGLSQQRFLGSKFRAPAATLQKCATEIEANGDVATIRNLLHGAGVEVAQASFLVKALLPEEIGEWAEEEFATAFCLVRETLTEDLSQNDLLPEKVVSSYFLGERGKALTAEEYIELMVGVAMTLLRFSTPATEDKYFTSPPQG